MKNKYFYIIIALFISIWAHRQLDLLISPPPFPSEPKRIVSLAPSVTETLYALGMGQQVVGVTQFCKYPADATSKPRVAGFSDVNYEAVLRQRPDLVVIPKDKVENKLNLERLGINTLSLDTRSLFGLMNAISVLGQATGHVTEAEKLLSQMENSIIQAQKRAEGKKRPRVLFSIMHSYQGLGYISEINIVGKDGFYNDMVNLAGGDNVYKGHLPFPRVSREAIIFLDPEVIVDIIPYTEDLDEVKKDWLSLGMVSAVKNGRIVFLTDGSDTVPGPRFPITLEKLSYAFHP